MKITNIHNLPQSIVNAVANDSYGGPKGELKRISVTTLKDSPRIHFLKARHWQDLKEDVSERLWALLGTAVHSILERAEDKHSFTEERFEEEVDGIIISGQLDVLKENAIEDYKITSVWTAIYNPTGKLEWEQQQNIYRWLAFKRGFKCDELRINMILRDHQSSKAEQGGDYPPIPFVTIKLPVWDLAKTEAYIKERVALFKSCIGLEDNALPACSSEEMWEKPATYAIMKPGRKTAVKVCETMAEAEANKGPGMDIVVRPGSRNRCEKYCPVKEFCSIYKGGK